MNPKHSHVDTTTITTASTTTSIHQFHADFVKKYATLFDSVLDTSDLSLVFSLVIDAMQMISVYDTLSGLEKKQVITQTILDMCRDDTMDTVLYHLIDALVYVDKDDTITFQHRRKMNIVYQTCSRVYTKVASWFTVFHCTK